MRVNRSDGQFDWNRPSPNMYKGQQTPTRDWELLRPELVEPAPATVYAPLPPSKPPRNRLLPVVVAMAVVLVLVIGILIGVVVSGGSSTDPANQVASPATTSAPPPTDGAPPTTSRTTTSPPQAGSATATGGPVELTGLTDTQQLRVTPTGQDLDSVVGDNDRNEDVQFSAGSNEFWFNQAAALWPDGTRPTADDCARQILRQPLSSDERHHLSNNPLVSVCTYTSHGNIAFVRSVEPAEGEGVQVSVTVWQTTTTG